MISKKASDRLEDIKGKIKASSDYFYDNHRRFNEFMNFVFNTTLTAQEINKLELLQKPAMEFNVLEALISRLRGEFAKQEPGLMVRAADGVPIDNLTPEFIETINVVEAHLRDIFFAGDNDSLEYKIYSDLLAGGFSVVEIYTDYIHERSFDQNIFVDRVFDPCLTGFDPLARDSHKGDGEYCFQLVPKTKEEFELEFGKDALKDISFTRTSMGNFDSSVDGFNWSYKNQDQAIVLVADFYEKKKKQVRIVKLSNDHVMLKKDYPRLLEVWDEMGFIEQAPVIVSERWSEEEVIERYRLCGERILEHRVTDYRHLPLVFIDGNSVIVRQDDTGASTQMTRPYVYHAKGIQQLKNFAGQTVAAEIENMVQHKFKVAVEAIPENQQDAYQNVQQASVLMYHAYNRDNPDQPLPPPAEIQRTPTPPIVEATFMGSDQVTQSILGSYDGVLGINGNQISGVAIQQGAMQSNAAALPYLMGYIKGLNRIANIIVDLIPKYYVTPRSIPVRGKDGRRGYRIINTEQLMSPVPQQQNSQQNIEQEIFPGQGRQPGSPVYMQYDPNDLAVRVEAGVNSAVQKQVALEQIVRMMQASQLFAEFINTKGLETILDNLDIRGVDQLKEKAAQFMREQEQAAEAAQNQPDPMLEIAKEQIETEQQTEMARIQSQREKAQGELATATARVSVEKQRADTEYLKAIAQIQSEKNKQARLEARDSVEDAKDAVEMAIDVTKHQKEMESAFKIDIEE